jgi:hypothetical protein
MTKAIFMNKIYLQIILLVTLLFSIAHASIIAIEDDCDHASVHEYILEQSSPSDCGDLCDMHHLFHFMAIIESVKSEVYTAFPLLELRYKIAIYTSPFSQTFIQPPIV